MQHLTSKSELHVQISHSLHFIWKTSLNDHNRVVTCDSIDALFHIDCKYKNSTNANAEFLFQRKKLAKGKLNECSVSKVGYIIAQLTNLFENNEEFLNKLMNYRMEHKIGTIYTL